AIHSAAQEIENARFDIYDAIVRYIFVTGRSRDLYDLNHISIQGFEIQP
ncbi:MAG: RND transporter, partial [Acinetobacter sp.]